MLSILVLCSVPDVKTTLGPFLRTFLRPNGGKFVFYEHISNPDFAEARWWQAFWSPIFSRVFGGCRLDCRTVEVVRAVGGWKGGDGEVWGKKRSGELPESLFVHRVGVFERE